MKTNEDVILGRYFEEITRLVGLNTQQEREMIAKAQQGDQNAENKVVQTHLKFVISIAKKYKWSQIPLEDLINEGNLGLIKAVRRFDLTKKYKFISYAVWWIRQAIIKYIYLNKGAIRIPQNQYQYFNKIAKNEQEDKTHYHKTIGQVHNEQMQKVSLSLDTPLNSTDQNASHNLAAHLEDDASSLENQAIMKALSKDLKKALSILPEREAEIISLRFGLGNNKAYSLGDIGTKYKLSKERIRQLEQQALRRIRENSALDLKAYITV